MNLKDKIQNGLSQIAKIRSYFKRQNKRTQNLSLKRPVFYSTKFIFNSKRRWNQFRAKKTSTKGYSVHVSLIRIVLISVWLFLINEKSFSQAANVTRIVTDYGRYWSSTNNSNTVLPDSSHHLLGFTYGNVLYSTGVNDPVLSANSQTYTAGNWWAFPAIFNGQCGSVLRLTFTSKLDGTKLAAIASHNNIKNRTPENTQTDGIHGLDIGTGFANLPTNAVSIYPVQAIVSSKISDAEPDILVTQIAGVATTGDVYKFLDAAGNTVGNQVSVMFNAQPSLGRYGQDQHYINPTESLSTATATGAIYGSNATSDYRLIAFKLSEFGITSANFSQVKSFTTKPSGETDFAFVAYNASSFNVPPGIGQNKDYSDTVICASGTSSAFLSVRTYPASGGTLSHNWQVSTDGGSTWTTLSNGGTCSGATTTNLSISAATVNYKYRAIVTESGTGYSSISDVFTIRSVTGSALGGTLNPTSISPCSYVYSANTTAPTGWFLSVAPSGGTGNYSYQWSVSSSANGTYVDIPGAIDNMYKPDLSVAGTNYYKVQIKSGCYSNLSTAATVTVGGGAITSVTNGAKCATTGAVELKATSSSGSVNWYAATTGGTALATGNSYSPTPTTTTTYYVASVSSSPACESARVPVVASVFTSSLALTVTATGACVGSGSTVTIFNSSLTDGVYTINYTFSGANSVANDSASVSFLNGTGTFITNSLTTSGSTIITISGALMSSGCTITSFTNNTANITVSGSGPAVSNFSVSATSACTNNKSIVTISSSTLASGTYLVTYSISGTNVLSETTAQVVFTAGSPGTGSFTLPLLTNTGTNNILNVTRIALLATPNCSSTLTSSRVFANNSNPILDAGNSFSACATAGTPILISGSSSASDYSALAWSTSNGTGTFTNNTTAFALTNTSYSPTAADITTGSVYLTLTATANSGCSDVIKTITLSLSPNAVGGAVSSNQTVTYNTSPTTLTLSGYTGSISNWEKSTDPAFTSPTTLGITSASLTGANIGNLTATTYFRAKITRGTCVAYSSYVTISISGSPTIISFTPTTAAAGTTVTITGTNFTGSTAVSFGGVAASSFSVVNSTTITAVVGSGASGSVSVTNTNGTGSLTGFIFCTTVTPAITIVADANNICSGSTVRFNASITNGGSSPTYQWKKNGVNVGISSSLYTDAGLVNGDVISCELTSSAVCVTSSTVSSNSITVGVTTVGSAVSSGASCINNVLNNITHTTTGATGIGTGTGLPSGVTASWSNNIITISGTPTVTGTFNYSIPLTGGCGTVNATGSITVNAGPTSAVLSGTTSVCKGNSSNLQVVINGGTSPYTVVYSNGTSNVTVSGYTSGSNIVVTPVTTTTYSLVSVTGTEGCTLMSSSSTVVSVYNSFIGSVSNNWSNGSNWCAGVVPASTDDIVITNGTVLLDTNFTAAGSLTLSGLGSLTIKPGKTLTVAGVVDFGNQSVILQSDVTGTAAIGTVSGTLTNASNVTVERYIPKTEGSTNSSRRWRLLTAPIQNTNINSAWQNGGKWNGTDVLSDTTGTIITGNQQGNAVTANNNGFDFWSAISNASASIRTYTQGTTQGSWSALSNTITAGAFDNQEAYLLFIRGNRNSLYTAGTESSRTTLRATGTLKQGTKTVNINGTKGYTLLGNPYAAPLDFDHLYNNTGNSSVIKQQFWVWDAATGDYGGYKLIKNIGGTYLDIPTPFTATTGTSTNLTIIQSGQGFFVEPASAAGGTLTIRENDKAANGAAPVNVLLRAGNMEKMRINLYQQNNNTTALADGVMAVYENSYNTSVKDNDDVRKPNNFNENIAIVRNGIYMMMEARPLINDKDTLFLEMWNLKQQPYQLQLKAEKMEASGLRAFLEDTYLQTKTAVSLQGDVVPVNFTVTSDAASAALNRFRLLFTLDVTPVLDVNQTQTNVKLYPNPLQGTTASVQLQQMKAGHYTIRLENYVGQLQLQQQFSHAGGSGNLQLQLPAHITGGLYVVKYMLGDVLIKIEKLIIE